MGPFDAYLEKIDNLDHRTRTTEVLRHVKMKFPNLIEEIKWNQPMFTDHGTFIISFSVSKQHLAMSPESKTLEIFDEEIKAAGYERTKMLLKLPWNKPVNYELLEKMIVFNIEDKKDMTNFWREPTR